MRTFRSRVDDSTFELNLAPLLDIIVSIVPMLLLSVAFMQVTMIETPIPQVVEKAIAAANEKNKDVSVQLSVSKKTGFHFMIKDHDQTHEADVALKGADLDLEGLHKQTLSLKQSYPDVFKLELNPEENVPLSEIVQVMDNLRMTAKAEPKVVFKDEAGKPLETNLLFPDIVFGNVTGG